MANTPPFSAELDSLHPLEKKILSAFPDTQEQLAHDQLRELANLEEDQFRRAIGWLITKSYVTVVSESSVFLISLTDKGSFFAAKGTPEMAIIRALQEGRALHMKDLRNFGEFESDDLSKAIGVLKRNNIVTIDRGVLTLKDDADVSQLQAIETVIQKVSSAGQMAADTLLEQEQNIVTSGSRKRGKGKGIFRVDERVSRVFQLSKRGETMRQAVREAGGVMEEISQLSPAMLKDGSWRGKSFRKYNISLPSPRIIVGRKHPYREFLDTLKQKLTSMGFVEMKGNLVETEFWNMDALFMPQFHSARDIHDVYYVAAPSHARELEEPFATNVAQCHENGADTGSSGWGYPFSVERAKQLILRSQGTVLSARTLASGPEIPGKYFAIARCFRYDHIDATHAPDFYQVEGIVIGESINFRHLLGLLKLFAEEVARASEVKYLPAYFPFTEPSVEVHIRHEQLGWMEMGGAGLFRPEVTKPLGVEVPVIAWGLGIDRMAMVALGIEDIRDLFSTDLNLIRSTTIPL